MAWDTFIVIGTLPESIRFSSGSVAVAATLIALAAWLALDQRSPEASLPIGDSPTDLAIAQAPLAFEASAGRFGDRVDFVSRSVSGGSLYVGSGEALLQVPRGKDGGRALHLDFLGSAAGAPAGLEELPGKANSFIGDDPSRWRTGIPTYGAVRYPSLYPGIALEFHGNQSALEYDFRLAPGADPDRIAVGLRGADSLRIERGGDLLIDLGGTTVRQHAPVAYQWIGGERRTVAVAFELRASTLGFRLGRYDRGRPLVIDPMLTYSTYLGGSQDDFGFNIAVDNQGAAYVSGQTESADFPLEDHFRPDQALTDAFVTKFNPAADGEPLTISYSTYLGASKDDFGGNIAIDDEGAAYVAGTTASENFPTVDPIGGPVGGDLGSFDAYITKFSPDNGGTVGIDYSTYLSGSGTESGVRIAIGPDGAAYVTGSTDSTDFAAFNEFQKDQGLGDMFLTRINPDSGGQAIVAFSTYIGGSGNQERATDIDVDSQGGIYIAGVTDGIDFPTQDPFEKDDGGFDALAIKFNPYTGPPVTLAYSTYLGGSQGDFASSIAVDSTGAAHLVGGTDSTNFPTVLPFEIDQAGEDAFVVEIAPDAGEPVALNYSTYLGGALSESAQGVAVDSDDDAVVVGGTASAEFPVSIEPLFGNQPGRDGFVTEFVHSPGKNVEVPFSTYIGGSGSDEANSVAVDPQDSLYVFGSTDSTDFPLRGQFQKDQPLYDAWLAKLGEPPTPPTVPAGKQPQAKDVTPPETTIVKKPKKKVQTKKKQAKVALRFVSSEQGSRFECALDKKAFAPCTSPRKFAVKAKPKPRRHSLRVRAIDAAGNTDPSPAEARFKLKRKPAG